jgi:anti-sigma B factor antagonist
MTHQCAVDVVESTGALRIRVRGEVDMACAPELLDTLLAADVPSGGTLVVDLAGVTFMDSAGISALVEAHRQREASGVALRVVEVPPLIAKMLRITGVDPYLDVSPAAEGLIPGH